ncbi:MAG: serine/threonine-protein kinase [Myxococcota bacterium]
MTDTAEGVRPGLVLAERYALRRPIGRGGMGAVWEAEHTTLGTPVAVKLMRPEIAATERGRARFLREARAAASLRSPTVVQILDYGVHEEIPYLAMELLEGESLRERLVRKGTLTPGEATAILGPVCRALTRAHAAGIVHRDLKPDNIFIVADGEGEHVKVLDFGIAKAADDGLDVQTKSGAMMGTPYYMSPEQARNASDAEPRSDLWSVAVIAYECLVGRRPFDADSLPALSVQILVGEIPRPSQHASVPAPFDAWFLRATSRDLEGRFATARALSSALADALGVTVDGAMTVGRRPDRSRRSGLLTAAAALAIGGAAWWGMSGRTPARAPVPDPVRSDATPVATQAPAADDPAAATIRLDLTGPAGARVELEGTLLGTVPGQIDVPRGSVPVRLQISGTGYAPSTLDITPDRDQAHTITLAPSPAPPPTKAKGGTPRKANVEDLEF